MSNPQVVSFDAIRSLAHGSVAATYAAIGGPFANIVRLICLTNNSDGDMFFSIDGTTDQLFVAAGSFKLFDLNTNRTHRDQLWALPEGTQFYVRYNTAPTKGNIYIECLWGQ